MRQLRRGRETNGGKGGGRGETRAGGGGGGKGVLVHDGDEAVRERGVRGEGEDDGKAEVAEPTITIDRGIG
jgi:hypothetical protein